MLIRIETWEKIFNSEIDIKKYIINNNLTPDEYDPEYDISKLPFISLIIYKLNYKNLLQFVNKTFINILIILKNLILNFYKIYLSLIILILISNVCLDSTNLINESTSNSSLFKDIKDFISNLISMNPLKFNSSSISPLPSPNKIEVEIVSNDEISKIISETNNSVIPLFLSFVKNNLNNPRILKFIKTISFVLIFKFIKNYESLFEWLKFLPVLISSVLDLSIIDVIKSKY